jgi:hypothetical protein
MKAKVPVHLFKSVFIYGKTEIGLTSDVAEVMAAP